MSRVLLVLSLLAFSSTASAQLEPLKTFELNPPEPDSATNVEIHLAGLVTESCTPREAVVRHDGNTIDISFAPYPAGVFCLARPFFWDKRIDLGRLAAGTYTVHARGDGLHSIFDATRQLVVRDANAPFVLTPPVAAVAGGTAVSICCVFQLSTVAVGGTPATLVNDPPVSAFGPFSFIAPPHAAGAADVTVTSTGDLANGVQTSTLFRYYDPAAPPDPSTFTKVLFPVFYNGAGAFGSRWETNASVTYSGSGRLAAWRDVTAAPPAHSIPAPLDPALVRPRGLFFHPARLQAAQVDYSLRIRDTSRDEHNAWTEVPVVFESDVARSVTLTNVPADPRGRHTLSVYAWDDDAEVATFAVRAADGTSIRIPNASTTATFVSPCASTPCDAPASFTVDLDPYLAQIADGSSATVTVSNGGLSARIWAMVTITDNLTQHVSLVTPHRDQRLRHD